jgi:hypothetical protein
MHRICIFKDSGNTPELVHRAQFYNKSHANKVKSSEQDFYTTVLTPAKYFSTSGIRIFEDSGHTPELAYRALLRQVAIALTDCGYVAMFWYPGSKVGSTT